jgi:hypothetical protein
MLERFVLAYLECVMFTDSGEPDQPPADAEFSASAVTFAYGDCARFVAHNWRLIERTLVAADNGQNYDIECMARDFWYTRNGHGVGFWDRGLGAFGEALTVAAEKCGECFIYQADDGLIYFG